MTRFTNGPATAASGLCLRRAPLFLRVVQSSAGTWDALDQLDDQPQADETIYAYRLVANEGMVHIYRAGAGSGFFVRATYEFVEPQPVDATLRDTLAWRRWCQAEYATTKGVVGG